jgi:hypothetical protein
MTLTLEVDLPADLARFRLPEAVAARLQSLLDRQDSGQPLSVPERGRQKGWSPWPSSSPCCDCGPSE